MQGYTQIWNKNLKPHFGEMTTLREYRNPHGSLFLTKLAKTYRPYTVKNIKNLASALFAHATNIDLIELTHGTIARCSARSWRTVKQSHTRLEEIENIITALVDCVECQLIMALTYFCRPRRGEIQGLQWGDIDADYIHIRRNKVNGRVTTR